MEGCGARVCREGVGGSEGWVKLPPNIAVWKRLLWIPVSRQGGKEARIGDPEKIRFQYPEPITFRMRHRSDSRIRNGSGFRIKPSSVSR